MNNPVLKSLLASALLSLVWQPVYAQTLENGRLSGQVSHFEAAPVTTRLTRPTTTRSGQVSSDSFLSPPQSGLIDTRAFNGLRGNADLRDEWLARRFARMDNRMPYQGQVQRRYTNPDAAPYVWAQSGQGGYDDLSGTCKERVWGDKLINYGGKFADGSPVPKGPVTVNKMGHVWWQQNLKEPGFIKKTKDNWWF